MTPLYEDNHIIIVSKTVREIVQADKTGDKTLMDSVKAYIKEKYCKPGDVFIGLPHRLDRPTSGIVVFARTSKALTRLNAMFRDGDIHKTYWAITANKPPQEEGTLENYLQKNEKLNKSFIAKQESKEAKKAVLNYKIIAATSDGPPSPNPLPTRQHRLPREGRPQIRLSAQQSRRRTLASRPPRTIRASGQQGGNRRHRTRAGRQPLEILRGISSIVIKQVAHRGQTPRHR